jgi:hypothetical protein
MSSSDATLPRFLTAAELLPKRKLQSLFATDVSDGYDDVVLPSAAKKRKIDDGKESVTCAQETDFECH